MHEIVSRNEAKSLGLVRYFTGVPCKHEHVAERLTINGACVECSREKSKNRYWDNRDADLAKQKAWREANKDKLNAAKERRRIENDPGLPARKAERERRKKIREDARCAGEVFYFDGVPCPSGHVSERFVRDAKCRECNRIQSKNQVEKKIASCHELKKRREDFAKRKAEIEIEKADAKEVSRKWREAGEARRSALENGESRYYSERPCQNGHIGQRFTASGGCCTCYELFEKGSAKRADYFKKRYLDRQDEFKQYNKDRYKNNAARFIEATRDWCIKNPEKRREIRKRHKEKMSDIPEWLLMQRMRSRIRFALLNGGFKKENTTEKILGCTIDELRAHIERQFTKGMSWDRFDEIHIDHIVPLSSAKTEEDVIRLCHFTNLRPMWAKENLQKGSKHVFLI